MKELRKALWIILAVSVLFRVLLWLDEVVNLFKFHYVVGYTLLAFSFIMNKVFALAGSVISIDLVRRNEGKSPVWDKILCALYIVNLVLSILMLV